MAPRPLALIAAAAVALMAAAADAQPATSEDASAPGASESSDKPGTQPPEDSVAHSLGLGDPGGLRGTLAADGFTYSLTYIGEVLGNLSGGQRRGGIYEGRLDAQFDLDLGKAAGWSGASLHANVYQIHGRGLSRANLGNLFTASGIEAVPSTRLFELWFEQKLGDDKVAIRAGQLAADTEFVVSQYASVFVNSTFGFPAILGADLPDGGPAFPLATPGLRVKVEPDPDWTLLLGMFDGAPAGNRAGDPQANNRSGIAFRTSDPALFMAEIAWTHGDTKAPETLPGTVKLGAFGHLGSFPDQRVSATSGGPGLLADPAGSGLPRRLHGNGGGYIIVDQLLAPDPGSEDGGLGGFVRLAAAPGDRNLVSAYVDGGLTYKGLLPGRPNDTAGIGFALARISEGARRYDADVAAFDPGTYRPVRSSEVMLEATYQAEIVPGFTVQPDVQYIWRPSGGVINPRSATGAVEQSAAILGMRTSIRY